MADHASTAAGPCGTSCLCALPFSVPARPDFISATCLNAGVRTPAFKQVAEIKSGRAGTENGNAHRQLVPQGPAAVLAWSAIVPTKEPRHDGNRPRTDAPHPWRRG